MDERILNEELVTITTEGPSLYGVKHAGCEHCAKKILVFVPALGNTRIGPQRLYVDVARVLATKNIASFRVDIPSSGDSYEAGTLSLDYASESIENISTKLYEKYLQSVLNYLHDQGWNSSQLLFVGFSIGAIPILNFAKKYGLARVILISANYLDASEFDNPTGPTLAKSAKKEKVDVFLIYGENEAEFQQKISFWHRFHDEGYCNRFDNLVIPNADHNFMSFAFKKAVVDAIVTREVTCD